MNLIKQLLAVNYTKGVIITPEYIVIHETDNWKKGANAQAHANYWGSNPNAQASVHFVCDDHSVYQLAEYELGKCWRCWHVGDGDGSSGITNSNTIGIEICVNSDGDYMKARANAIELVKWLMPQVNLTPDKVVRHYDASFKHCPRNMLDNPSLWVDFKNQIGGTVTVTHSVLQKGSQGSEVETLQNLLNNKGYSLTTDGDFGNMTYNAVADFQTKNGLTVDGIVGNTTWNKLEEVIQSPVQTDTRDQQIVDLKAQIATKDVRIQELTDMYYKLLSDVKSIGNKYA